MKTKEQIIEKVKEYGRFGYNLDAMKDVLIPLNDYSRDDISEAEKEGNLFRGFKKIAKGAKLGLLLGYRRTVRHFDCYKRERIPIPDNLKWRVGALAAFKKGLPLLGCCITYGCKGVSVGDIIFIADNKYGKNEDLAIVTSVSRYYVDIEIIGVFDKKTICWENIKYIKKVYRGPRLLYLTTKNQNSYVLQSDL